MAHRSPDMPETLQRLRRGLLCNPGGDRVMSQVLAIVLAAGLDAVLVAVELALETGRPGEVSVEHVVNLLPERTICQRIGSRWI